MRLNKSQIARAAASQPEPEPEKEAGPPPVGVAGYIFLALGFVGMALLGAWLALQPMNSGFVEARRFLDHIRSSRNAEAYQMLCAAWKADEPDYVFNNQISETMKLIKSFHRFKLLSFSRQESGPANATAQHTYKAETPDGDAMVKISLAWNLGRWTVTGLEIQSPNGYFRRSHVK